MKKIIIIIASFLLLTSCNDWLDIQPELEIREEKMFETEQGFKDVLTGVYIRMATSSLYGFNTSMLLPEFMAQHWEPRDSDLGPYLSDFDFTQTNSEAKLKTIWVQYYQCIVNVNSVLEKLDEKKDLFQNGNYELIKGEALGLRAFLHFEVLRYWGDVPEDIESGSKAIPYMKVVTKDPNLLVSLSYQEVLDNILQDLTESETLLANDPILSFSPDVLNDPTTENNLIVGDDFHYFRKLRFNLFAVKATLARYYMWLGNTSTAAEYAMEIINATENEENSLIFTLGTEDDASQGELTFPSEQIFAVNNSSATATLYDPFFDFYKAYTLDHAKLEEAYEATIHTSDIRFKNDRLWEIKIQPEKFNYFKKYWKTETTAVEDVPLIRLAEMYFIVTENGDIDLFRDYRIARGLDISIDGSLSSHEAIMERLEKEYRKDFYGEGQMFFFYKRLGYETFPWPTTIDMERENYKLPIPETQSLFE
jgi:hypothetical protein